MLKGKAFNFQEACFLREEKSPTHMKTQTLEQYCSFYIQCTSCIDICASRVSMHAISLIHPKFYALFKLFYFTFHRFQSNFYFCFNPILPLRRNESDSQEHFPWAVYLLKENFVLPRVTHTNKGETW